MKLHVVFSLNVTSSFVDDIFRVVGSIRYCLYGKFLAVISSKKVRSNFLRFTVKCDIISQSINAAVLTDMDSARC